MLIFPYKQMQNIIGLPWFTIIPSSPRWYTHILRLDSSPYCWGLDIPVNNGQPETADLIQLQIYSAITRAGQANPAALLPV